MPGAGILRCKNMPNEINPNCRMNEIMGSKKIK
jgi:hypothetical protein